VVANKDRPRWRGNPDWRDRIRFVEGLQDRFSGRIAIFGRGWTGPGAQGVVGFDRQHEAIASGWVSANWDHYASEPKSFSNRLPIALSAGTIHATVRHPGYEEIFPASSRFMILGDSPDGLADAIARYLESTPPAERLAHAVEAQEFAWARFRQDDQLVQMLNSWGTMVDPSAASASWDLDAELSDEL
jgi:hypothetical protein